MFRNLVKGIVIPALVIILLATYVILPVSATPSEEGIIIDHLFVTYAQGNFASVNGSWTSPGGLLEGAGGAVQYTRHAGWPGNGWQFQNATSTTTLSNDNGTITIKDQITQIEWVGFDFKGRGNWVILDGTGAYADLHGQGTSTLEAFFHRACPDASVTGACIIIDMGLIGSGHIDP